MNGIIMSNNSNFAYELRYKLSNYGFRAEYISNFESLLRYCRDNQEGVVFIKSNSARLQRYIKQYTLMQQSKNYIFVFLSEENAIHIERDNKSIFFSTFESVQDLIPELNKNMCSKLCFSDTIPPQQIDRYLSEILNNIQFPKKMMGYSFLRDAIYLMMTDHVYRTCIKNVYEVLGKRYNKNIANIEKSIRIAINNFVQKSKELTESLFKKDKVSNIEFIEYIIDKIKQMYCCA